MKESNRQERKARLTTQQLDYCMLHILRNSELFSYARQHLKAMDFSLVTEARYALLWAAALATAERSNGILPEPGAELAVAMDLTSKIDNSAGGEFTPEAAESSIDLLAWIFGFELDQLNPAYYKIMVQDLIVERTIIGAMSRDMTLARDIGRPVDILKSLENYNQKLQSVLLDHSKVGQTAFPANIRPKKLGKFSTGELFMDSYMNGGQAPGEVYVILGPTGLGKTTMAVMLTVSTARVWNGAFLKGVIPAPKISCFFTWEQDLERLRHRFWAFAAKIDSSRLELFADEATELSTRGHLEAYELLEFADQIRADGGPDRFEGEYERLQGAVQELGDCVSIFDFSGAAENPRLGEGGLDEVAAVLHGMQKEGKDIGVVVLDYANAAVRRMLAAKGEDPSNMRHYLANFCNECRSKIAIPFKCPVWVLNQLNTESNRKAPTAEQHHSYASECGNFAENAWFAFVFSTKDKVNNTCRLYCSKERRAKGDLPPVILKIEGNFCRMRDVSATYAVNEPDKQYSPRDITDRRVDLHISEEQRQRMEDERPGSNSFGSF